MYDYPTQVVVVILHAFQSSKIQLMSKAKTLNKIEQDMESGSEQKRIDALLDAFEYGDADCI